MKQQQLDWRRSKVLELSSQGYSEREVSEVLKVSDSAVHRDLVFTRKQIIGNLYNHINERIPFEVEKAMAGMDTILRMASYIANTVTDPRTKLQALSLMNEFYKQKIELTTNCIVVRDALDYMNDKAKKIKLVSKSESDSKESGEPDYGEEELEEEKKRTLENLKKRKPQTKILI